MSRPRLLDLFCGAGGAAMGYHRAGFDVVGVDIAPQPHYPFPFVQGDALSPPVRLEAFDAIHASPPCQHWTQMSARFPEARAKHPDLLTPTLELVATTGLPWVVENVPGARKCPAFQPTLALHGGMFDLGVHRPRLFQSNVMLLAPTAPRCAEPIGVYGTKPTGHRLWTRTRNNGNWRTAAVPKKSILRAPRSLEEAQAAMGMDWADWRGTKEAIPPAYAEWIGAQLMRHLGHPPQPHAVVTNLAAESR